MRSSILLVFVFCVFYCACVTQNGPGAQETGSDEARLTGPYLGQDPPAGSEPLLFAPGIVSTAAFELNSAFTPDGRELIQTLVVDGWGFSAIISRSDGPEGWGEPRVASFSGRFNDIDPNLSPDGNRVLFISRRPTEPSNDELSPAWDIWTSGRGGVDDSWGPAERLPEPVNSVEAELYPSITTTGTIYFGSNRPGGFGGFDIYRAHLTEEGYTEVENLGERINSEHAETDAFIAPDESFLVVTVTGREDSRGKNDLYISFAQDDGSWGDLHHMGDDINTPAKEYCPVVTPDGRFFFFTRGKDSSLKLHGNRPKDYEELAEKVYSWRNNLENIYWVDAAVLQPETYE